MADPVFHRPDFANDLADRILSDGVLSPARSGLFLAAHRQVDVPARRPHAGVGQASSS